MTATRESLINKYGGDYPDMIFLDPEFLDDAIIGVTIQGEYARVVYSQVKCIEAFMKNFDDQVDEEDEAYDAYTQAVQWYEYNTERGVLYMGPYAPILVDDDFSRG